MQTDELISQIEQFSKNQLLRKEDLYILTDLIIKNQGEKELDEIAFSSKYIMGLMRIVQSAKGNPQIQNLENIGKDFQDNIKKVTERLKMTLAYADELYRSYFEKEYLQMTRESLHNLNQLLGDLEWIKRYLNYKKRLN